MVKKEKFPGKSALFLGNIFVYKKYSNQKTETKILHIYKLITPLFYYYIVYLLLLLYTDTNAVIS